MVVRVLDIETGSVFLCQIADDPVRSNDTEARTVTDGGVSEKHWAGPPGRRDVEAATFIVMCDVLDQDVSTATP